MSVFFRSLGPVLLAAGIISTGWGETSALSQIGLLPSDRRTDVVIASERNPFAKIEEPKVEQVVEEAQELGEEGQIVAALGAIEVAGRARSDSGWKILFGDMILEKGKMLAPVVEGQTHQLKVAEIFDSVMEIEWIQDDATASPKRIFIPIALMPSVRSGGVQAASDAASPGVRAQVTQGPEERPNATPNAQ